MLEARIDHVFGAARAAGADEPTAAEITRRLLVADPHGPLDSLAARAALLAADRTLDDALVLARALGWKTDRIAAHLRTTQQDVRGRIARGLRTLLPPPGCAAAASPGRGARVS